MRESELQRDLDRARNRAEALERENMRERERQAMLFERMKVCSMCRTEP